jgi:hypothetical protein
MSTQHQFLQRTIATIEQNVQQLTAMYLQAVSTKNIGLAEQCEVAILSAYESIKVFNQTLNLAQRPIRKTVQ